MMLQVVLLKKNGRTLCTCYIFYQHPQTVKRSSMILSSHLSANVCCHGTSATLCCCPTTPVTTGGDRAPCDRTSPTAKVANPTPLLTSKGLWRFTSTAMMPITFIFEVWCFKERESSRVPHSDTLLDSQSLRSQLPRKQHAMQIPNEQPRTSGVFCYDRPSPTVEPFGQSKSETKW